MNRWLVLAVLVLLVLAGAMATRSIVVVAGTSAPVPPGPWFAGTSAPVPPGPWMGTSAPVPPGPWMGTSAPVPPGPWM
jgi:hypothetical protein